MDIVFTLFRPANKPKPNTRFLRNIIKDTDSHNAALLAKETAESRARLRSLASSERMGRKPSRVGAGDIRKRQLGDIAAILGGRGRVAKRKRTEAEMDGKVLRYANTSSGIDEPQGKPKEELKAEVQKKGERRKRTEDAPLYRVRHKRGRSASPDRGRDGEDRKKRYRSRSRSPIEKRDRESRYRHRSPRRKRSLSPDGDRSREKTHRSHRHRHSPSAKSIEYKSLKSTPSKDPEPKPKETLDYDSDPLDDIIGPPPPPVTEVRTRGRGTMSHTSGIDSRFSASYDPATDVQLDPDEENDWDQALEALKDRQKWKQQGAERLRAAGFTDDEIRKWEKGGEKREEDVTWAKKGESREWDRGKVVDQDGVVSIESQFGRLKDS